MKSTRALNILLVLLNLAIFALSSNQVCIIRSDNSNSCTSRFVIFENGLNIYQSIKITGELYPIINLEISNSKFQELLLVKLTSNGFSISNGDGSIRSYGSYLSVYELGATITIELISFEYSIGLALNGEVLAEIPLTLSGPYMISTSGFDKVATYELVVPKTNKSSLCSVSASTPCNNSGFVGIPSSKVSKLSVSLPIAKNISKGFFIFSIAGYTQTIGIPMVEIAADTENIFITSYGKTIYKGLLPNELSNAASASLIFTDVNGKVNVTINGSTLGDFDLSSPLSSMKFLFQAINKPAMNVVVTA